LLDRALNLGDRAHGIIVARDWLLSTMVSPAAMPASIR
jgi:hypothetical protein